MPHDDALPVLFTTDAPVVSAVEWALSARGAADDGHGRAAITGGYAARQLGEASSAAPC